MPSEKNTKKKASSTVVKKTSVKPKAVPNNKKLLAIISIIIPAIAILISLLYTPSNKTAYCTFLIVSIIVCVVSIILSRVGNSKETKRLAIAGLIVSIIHLAFSLLGLITLPYFSQMVSNCEWSEDGTTANCEMKGTGQQMPIPIPSYLLDKEEK